MAKHIENTIDTTETFVACIKEKWWPKRITYMEYFTILLEKKTTGEVIQLNCFRNKKTKIYSPRNSDLDLKEVETDIDLVVTIRVSRKGYYNLIDAKLLDESSSTI